MKKEEQTSLFRSTIGPACVIFGFPVIVILVTYCVTDCAGSLINLISTMHTLAHEGSLFKSVFLPFLRPNMQSILFLLAFVASEAVFSVFLPGKSYEGPLSEGGNRPIYKQNGPLALFSTFLLWGGLVYLGVFPQDFVTANIKPLLGACDVFVYLFCAFLYVKGRWFPDNDTIDCKGTKNVIFDFFFGCELYPTINGFQLKQFIACRIGMVLWGLFNVAMLAAQYARIGRITNALFVSVAIEFVYTTKFFFWERGYLYSVDMCHDKWGLYLCWGTCVWMPFVHNVQSLYLALYPRDLPMWWAALLLVVGVGCTYINYCADQQRLDARENNGKLKGKDVDVIRAEFKTEDGKTHTSLLLCAGFWGISRHFHYLPDFVVTTSASLPAGFSALLPYMHSIYLGILLFDRTVRVDRICAAKYGEYWKEYCRRVPYRLIPGLY